MRRSLPNTKNNHIEQKGDIMSKQLMKQYYNTHAMDLFKNTFDIDLGQIYMVFEEHLKSGDKILDVGFGSGRDSHYFNDQKYEVVSIDFAKEVVDRGKILLNNEVLHVDVMNIKYENEFDGIWASAILLHFHSEEILEIISKFNKALKSGGVLYISFKYGTEEKLRHGRYFNDFDETKFNELFEKQTHFKVEKLWETQDARKSHPHQYWLNAVLVKK